MGYYKKENPLSILASDRQMTIRMEKLWLPVNKARKNRIAQMEQEFLFQPIETVKVEYLRRPSVCSGKFSVEPRIQFAFKPAEPEILPKWKAPLDF